MNMYIRHAAIDLGNYSIDGDTPHVPPVRPGPIHINAVRPGAGTNKLNYTGISRRPVF